MKRNSTESMSKQILQGSPGRTMKRSEENVRL